MLSWEVPRTGEKENQGLHATGLARRPIERRGETVGTKVYPDSDEKEFEVNGPE